MKANVRKALFILVLIILGIGVGILFIHDENSSSKQNIRIVQSRQELLTKYNRLNQLKHREKIERIDLSSDEDLAVAVMNLLGIEEHLFFTGAKTKKKEYYDLIDEVREVRKSLLKKLIPRYEGEVWCISKHLLAASYRLMEAGTKQLHIGNKQEAYELFEQAYKLYLLFWKINKDISSAKSSDPTSFVPDTNSNNKSAYSEDMLQSDRVNKSCIFNDSKINCCAE